MDRLPLQSACNPDDPREHMLWALVALPGPGKSAPLVMPVQAMEAWAEHLYRCGLRHHPELQEIKYVPPAGEVESWLAAPGGRWVPIDEELPAEVTAPDLSGLTEQEKKVLYEALKDDLAGGEN